MTPISPRSQPRSRTIVRLPPGPEQKPEQFHLSSEKYTREPAENRKNGPDQMPRTRTIPIIWPRASPDQRLLPPHGAFCIK